MSYHYDTLYDDCNNQCAFSDRSLVTIATNLLLWWLPWQPDTTYKDGPGADRVTTAYICVTYHWKEHNQSYTDLRAAIENNA